MERSNSDTSASLLLQIRDDTKNEQAWQLFVDRYGGKIYGWCLNRQLQPSDAEDVTQNILYKLARRLKSFEYNPDQSFRGWLHRVSKNAINDFFAEQNGIRVRGGSWNDVHLDLAQAREELTNRIASAFDLELMDRAISRVKQRVSSDRFDAWDLMARQRMSGENVANQLKMKIATVYTAKNQVQKLIQEEIQLLESDNVPDATA